MLVSVAGYLIIGLIAGLLAGLLGIGGGIVVVPALSWLLIWQGGTTQQAAMHYAIASSIACIVLTTLVSALSHKKEGNVNWLILRSLLPGLLSGSVIGAWVAHLLPASWLQLIFSVFALIIAVHLVLKKQAAHLNTTAQWPKVIISILIGFGSGFIASLIGLGGGVILVPVFLFFNLSANNAVGTSSVCTLFVSVAALIMYLLLPIEHINKPLLHSSGYVYWPAVFVIAIMSMIFAHIGAKLSKILSTIWLTRIFALLLVLISLRMFLLWYN